MKYVPRYYVDVLLAVVLLLVLVVFVTGIVPDVAVLIGFSLIGLVPVLWGAYKSLREGQWASMDLLASIALVFSLANGEWISAVFIELMLAAARILGDITRDRTEQSIRGLLKLRPEFALVEQNGTLIKKPLADVTVGDVVVMDIGERIPVDGEVLSGTAAVNESSLTGESLPVDKEAGDRVMSSTLVQSGSLRVRTTHTGTDTTLERVIRLVESAREEKPTSQTLGERFGKIYLIAILIASVTLYLFTHNVLLVLAVVLVVCADDIAVAIPIAYLRAISAAAKLGIVVKGGKHLEQLGKVTTIVFDKTGTLTSGVLVIADVVPVAGYTEEDVVRTAMFAAIRSNHPVSRALMGYAAERGYPEEFPDSVDERGGKGIVAQVKGGSILFGKLRLLSDEHTEPSSEVAAKAAEKSSEGKSIAYVVRSGELLGFVSASDKVKPNAKQSIAELRKLGVTRVVMLSGDNEQAARVIAGQLDIDEWHADLLPEDKVAVIKRLQESGPIAMVGDGVNDAAALSIASVGIAMGGIGSQGTIESAQIVLMRDDLAALPVARRIAQMAHEVSVQDFWIWGATNALGLVLVFVGVIGPPGAALYNFLSDFLPLFNSARVRAR